VVYFQLINTGGVLYQILERKEVKIMTFNFAKLAEVLQPANVAHVVGKVVGQAVKAASEAPAKAGQLKDAVVKGYEEGKTSK
jgi:hypothetical protein